MEYSYITCPITKIIQNVNSIDGITTILKYLKYSNLAEYKNDIEFLEDKIYSLSNETSSLGLDSNSLISFEKPGQKVVKKGRFTIIQNNNSEIDSEIYTDNEDNYVNSEDNLYYSSSSSYFSDSSSDFEFSEKKVNIVNKEVLEDKSLLSEDEKKWGKAPKGYIRKGRFLIKK